MRSDCNHGHPDGSGHPCIDCLDEEIARLRAEVERLDAESKEENRLCNVAMAERGNALLQIREKDDWIKALETRIDTMTGMLKEAGVIEKRKCPRCEKPLDSEGHAEECKPCPACGKTGGGNCSNCF